MPTRRRIAVTLSLLALTALPARAQTSVSATAETVHVLMSEQTYPRTTAYMFWLWLTDADGNKMQRIARTETNQFGSNNSESPFVDLESLAVGQRLYFLAEFNTFTTRDAELLADLGSNTLLLRMDAFPGAVGQHFEFRLTGVNDPQNLVTPEPTTLALVGTGLVGLFGIVARRRREGRTLTRSSVLALRA